MIVKGGKKNGVLCAQNKYAQKKNNRIDLILLLFNTENKLITRVGVPTEHAMQQWSLCILITKVVVVIIYYCYLITRVLLSCRTLDPVSLTDRLPTNV